MLERLEMFQSESQNIYTGKKKIVLKNNDDKIFQTSEVISSYLCETKNGNMGEKDLSQYLEIEM